MCDQVKEESMTTQKPQISSINPPWQISKAKAVKTERENDEWPSLENSFKKEKPSAAKSRERHSTGNSFDDKISKLKWEKLNFNITYKSKDQNMDESASYHRTHRHESSDFDKENDSTNRNKKSRSYIKHSRGGKEDSNGFRHHGNGNGRQSYPNQYHGNIHSNQRMNFPMPAAQFLPRVPQGLSYMMLYPANGKIISNQTDKDGLEVPSVPPACICILPPGTDQKQASAFLIREQIQRQIEFYFTSDNLLHDRYLRENMNAAGWVPISLISKFKRIVLLTQNLNDVIEAVKGSVNLEFDPTSQSVRTKHNPAFWPIKKIDTDKYDALQIDNCNSLILNYLVVLFPTFYIDKNTVIDQEMELSSKQFNTISTALNKFSNDVHYKARLRINDLAAFRYLQKANLVNTSSPIYQEPKKSTSVKADRNFPAPPSSFSSSSKGYPNLGYQPNITPEIQNSILQQWINQQYMFTNKFQVSTMMNPSSLQLMQTNNSIHAIPIVYMSSDGKISFFDQQQQQPSAYTNDPYQFFISHEQTTEASIDNHVREVDHQQKPELLPFFHVMNSLSADIKINYLSSFQVDTNDKDSSKAEISIQTTRSFGFLFNSLPNEDKFDDSKENEKCQNSILNNRPNDDNLRTLKSHPVKELLKMSKISMLPYEEFEKICLDDMTKDCTESSSLNADSLCEFWSFFLKLNPLQDLIAKYRQILLDNSGKFTSSSQEKHYSKILFDLYRLLPSQKILDIQKIILLDLKWYLEKFDSVNVDVLELVKSTLHNTHDATQKLAMMHQLLQLDITP